MAAKAYASAHIGPTLYTAEITRRNSAFALGMSLAKDRLDHPAAAYVVSVFALTAPDQSVQLGCYLLAQRLAALRPTSWLTSNTLVVTSAMAYVSLIRD